MKTKKPAPGLPFVPFVRPASITALRDELRANLPDPDAFGAFTGTAELPSNPACTLMPGENTIREIAPNDISYDYLEDDDDYEDDDTFDEDEYEPGDYEYDKSGAFIIRSGADWMAQNDDDLLPEATLFGSLWMQNDLCILFADTNVGKSILAVQIADSISRGLPIPGMAFTAEPAPVLYFDFELSEQQFRSRYSSAAQGKYPFTASFHRATLNPYTSKRNKFDSYEEFINNEIENALLACKAKTLIIDNITCLRYGTQNAAGAHSLMHYLQAIKRRYGISILVLAHTPKRNPAKPLSRNDLQGSKMLLNLADSAFAIGESRQQPGLRYLKQIKQRGSIETHGAENVCLGRISRTGSFLHFNFAGHSHENDHLAPHTEQYRRSTEHRIMQLNRQGQSVRKIAAQLGLAPTTVFRALKRIARCGEEEAPPMTNGNFTNDQTGCADVQMCECADEENECAGENQYAAIQATQQAPALCHSNINKSTENAAPPLSAQRREGRRAHPLTSGRGESTPQSLTPHEPTTHDSYRDEYHQPVTQHAPALCDSNINKSTENAAHPLSAQRREGRRAEQCRGESTPQPLTPHEPTIHDYHNTAHPLVPNVKPTQTEPAANAETEYVYVPRHHYLTIHQEIEGLTYLAKHEPLLFNCADEYRLQMLMKRAFPG